MLNDKEIKELSGFPYLMEVNIASIHSGETFQRHYLSFETKETFDRVNATLLDNHSGAIKTETIVSDQRELNDEEKEKYANDNPRMITPFVPEQVKVNKHLHSLAATGVAVGFLSEDPADKFGTVVERIISYGLSSFGYDVRLSDEFKIFTNTNATLIDPLDFDRKTYVEHKGEFCIIPPHSYALGSTIETFNIPRDIMVICVGKSTYARCGAIVNTTPIEPGFKGNVVIEIFNATSLPLKVYANQGIAQFLFFKGNDCAVSYADRKGKYMNQTGVQTALI